MRTYVLNNQTPSIKEGEFNSSSIGIIVPEDMRTYNLFIVFGLPSGEKVFTPSIQLDSKNMVTYAMPAAVLSEPGRVQVELQGYAATRYIKSVTYSFQVVKSLTGPTNGTGSELKKEDYLPWYTEAAGFKEEVEAIAGEYKLAEAQRVSKEIGRVAGESARVIAENNRVESETERIEAEDTRIVNEMGRFNAELERMVNENQRINDFSGKADKAQLAEIANNLVEHKLDYANLVGVNDRSIKVEKLDFISISSNLYNKATITIQKVINATTGDLADSASNNCTSGFIPIEPNTIYTRYCLTPITRMGYYTKEKVFISAVSGNASTSTPNNAYYARISVVEARIDTVQLNKGNVLLPYEPYYTLLPTDMIPIEDIKNKITSENSKSYYFAPENIQGFYNAPDGNYLLFNTVEEINSSFNILVDEHSDYITQTLLGNDQSGTYPIYQYTLKPSGIVATQLTKTLPKILIACGQHGREKGSIFSLYYMVKEICKNWKSNSLLEYLRWNVEIIFIPLVNPWAFTYGNGNGRVNSRGVDINRNYSYNWVLGDIGSNTYGGAESFSEIETQYVKNMIDANTDAIYFGDYHTNGSSGDSYNTLMWHSQTRNELANNSVQIASKYLLEKMTREFVKKYELPEDVGYFGYTTSPIGDGGMSKSYAASKGIPANTFETFRKFPTETEYYTSQTNKASTEYVVNWLLTLIRQFAQFY